MSVINALVDLNFASLCVSNSAGKGICGNVAFGGFTPILGLHHELCE
jgi:hypothetical protein